MSMWNAATRRHGTEDDEPEAEGMVWQIGSDNGPSGERRVTRGCGQGSWNYFRRKACGADGEMLKRHALKEAGGVLLKADA